MTRLLVVNADDLGWSRAVNAGIAAVYRQGIVTSASLLANGAAWEDAVALLRELPQLGVGVHLAWVDGAPLTLPSHVASLVDPEGWLWPDYTVFVRRYVLGQIKLDDVAREAQRQIERVLDAGLAVDHLDSHEHLHLLPGIWERMVDLAVRYRIPVVRLPREPLSDLWGDLVRLPGVARRTALQLAAAAGRISGGRIRHVDAFFGGTDSCMLEEPRLVRLLEAVPDGVSELMCHPGADGDAPGLRGRELDALMSPAARRAVQRRHIRLARFADVVAVQEATDHVTAA